VRGLDGDTGPDRTRRLEGSRGAKRFLKTPISLLLGRSASYVNLSEQNRIARRMKTNVKWLESCQLREDRLLDEEKVVKQRPLVI